MTCFRFFLFPLQFTQKTDINQSFKKNCLTQKTLSCRNTSYNKTFKWQYYSNTCSIGQTIFEQIEGK